MNDDAERIQELAADDEDAAQALIYRMFHKSVFQVAYRYLKNYEDAEETTDDVFLKAFQTLHQLSDAAKFPAWLRTIAKNLAIDRLRQTKRRGNQVPFDDTQSCYISTAQRAVRQTRVTLGNRLLRLLPPKDRRVMELRCFEEATYKEIAALTRATERAVANRVRRTRKYLKIVGNRLNDWLLSPDEEATVAIDLLTVIPVNEAKMVERYLLDQDSLAETARALHVSPRDVVKGLKHAMKVWKRLIASEAAGSL